MPNAISPTIFREYDVRGIADQDLTEDAVLLIARALGTLVRQAGGRSAVVGRLYAGSLAPSQSTNQTAGAKAPAVFVCD